jgi:hypothetical protein
MGRSTSDSTAQAKEPFKPMLIATQPYKKFVFTKDMKIPCFTEFKGKLFKVSISLFYN